MRLLKNPLFYCTIALFACIWMPACKKKADVQPVPLNKTTLKTLLDSVTLVYNAAVEGTKPGNYTPGAKGPLKSAIDIALQVNGGNVFIQEDVDYASSNLRKSVADFNARKIPEIAAANLVAQWKFDGNANDTTGHGHTGQLKTGWTGTTGTAGIDGATLPALIADRFNRADRAYDFSNGANIEIPYDTSLNPASVTLSLWVKTRVVDSSRALVSLNRTLGYFLQLDYNFMRVSYTSSNGLQRIEDNTSAIPSDVWTHIAVSFTANTLKFYLNGALLKTTTVAGNAAKLAQPVNMVIGNELPKTLYTFTPGVYAFTGANYFSGALDDLRLYNRVLTDAEVQTIYGVERTP